MRSRAAEPSGGAGPAAANPVPGPLHV